MFGKHGLIEHDVSLTQDDIAFSDNHIFNPDIWKSILSTYGDSKETNFALASKEFVSGIKEAFFSYGVSLCLVYHNINLWL